MKRSDRILLVIVIGWLLLAVVSFFQSSSERHKADPLECQNLKAWYLSYDDEYFGGMLPRDTVVGYGSADGAMAVTRMGDDGHFHIILEKKYTLASPVAHEALLHESCHIISWSEIQEHGPRFYDCMHRLYEKGAFEGLF